MIKKQNSKLLIINYHYIRDKNKYQYPGIHPLGWEEFVDQLNWLKSRYHMATVNEVESFVYGEKPLKEPSIFLTFDDGLAEHVKIASKILDSLDIKAAFFISTMPLVEKHALMVHKIHWLRSTTDPEQFRGEFANFLPVKWRQKLMEDKTNAEALRAYPYDSADDARLKYLINYRLPLDIADFAASKILALRDISEDEFCQKSYLKGTDIKKLSERGHVIGSHGHSHVPFSSLSRDALENELKKSISYLKEKTGFRPQWISYPYGMKSSVSEDTDELCRELGFTIGLGLDKQEWGWNSGKEPCLWLKRINTNEVIEFTK